MTTALPGAFPTFLSLFMDVTIAALYILMPSLVFPTVPFGVRVPLAYARHPAVMEERRRYTLRLSVLAAGILVVDFALYGLTRWAPLHALGMLLLVAGCWGVYYLSHRRLAHVKADQSWFADTRQAVIASVAPRPHGPSRMALDFLALPAAVILLTLAIGIWRYPALPGSLHYAMPAAFGDWRLARTPLTALLPVVFQLVVTLVFAGATSLRGIGPLGIDVEDPAGSQRQAQLIAQIIQVLLGLLALGIDAALLLAGLVGWGLLAISPELITLVILAPVLAWLIAAPALLLALRSTPRIPAAPAGRYVNRDDDRFWVLGMLYVNRDDPALLVNKRFGIGRTLNFGNPIAWVIALGLIAFIVFRILTR